MPGLRALVLEGRRLITLLCAGYLMPNVGIEGDAVCAPLTGHVEVILRAITGLLFNSILAPCAYMDRRRTLVDDGTVLILRELLNYHVLRNVRECRRAAIINGILARYGTAINVRVERCLSITRRVDVRVYALIRTLDVDDNPPVLRIATNVVLTALVIRAIDRLVAGRCASDAVIRYHIYLNVGR